MDKRLTRQSKFLSLVLRHQPGEIGLELDRGGWASVAELIDKMPGLTAANLDRIVAEDEKQRYQYNVDHTRIRASQGHSIDIDLGLEPRNPPPALFHGTAARFLESIWKDGLLRMNRQFVHLSADVETAVIVGRRHGDPAVLVVDAVGMQRDGHHTFYLSDNGVWLIVHVPPQFLQFQTM